MRELDCEIATKIFYWTKETRISDGVNDVFVVGTKTTRWYNKDGSTCAVQQNEGEIKDLYPSIPHYSTDMNDAWLLVDWLIKEKRFHFHLNWNPENKEWIAGGHWIAAAKTPQLAICKIALKVNELK